MKSKKQIPLSEMTCIQKTNHQLFGSVWKFLVDSTTTTKGIRRTLFTLITIGVVLAELIGGTWLIVAPLADAFGKGGTGVMLAGVAVAVTSIVCVFTLLYATTLYDNCERDNP